MPLGNEQSGASSRGLWAKETSEAAPLIAGHSVRQGQYEGLVVGTPVGEDATQSHLSVHTHALGEASPTPPMSDHKISIKRWFKENFSRRTNKGQKVDAHDADAGKSYEGAALDSTRRYGSEEPSLPIIEVAMAGRDESDLRRDLDNQDYSSDEAAIGIQSGSISVSLVSNNDESMGLHSHATSGNGGCEHAGNDGTAPPSASGMVDRGCENPMPGSTFIGNL